MYINLSLPLYIITFPHNLPLKTVFFYLPTPLAYCSLDFFIKTEVLAPDVFLQFAEQVETARSKIQAVG
jgi:hypothetical protein